MPESNSTNEYRKNWVRVSTKNLGCPESNPGGLAPKSQIFELIAYLFSQDLMTSYWARHLKSRPSLLGHETFISSSAAASSGPLL